MTTRGSSFVEPLRAAAPVAGCAAAPLLLLAGGAGVAALVVHHAGGSGPEHAASLGAVAWGVVVAGVTTGLVRSVLGRYIGVRLRASDRAAVGPATVATAAVAIVPSALLLLGLGLAVASGEPSTAVLHAAAGVVFGLTLVGVEAQSATGDRETALTAVVVGLAASAVAGTAAVTAGQPGLITPALGAGLCASLCLVYTRVLRTTPGTVLALSFDGLARVRSDFGAALGGGLLSLAIVAGVATSAVAGIALGGGLGASLRRAADLTALLAPLAAVPGLVYVALWEEDRIARVHAQLFDLIERTGRLAEVERASRNLRLSMGSALQRTAAATIVPGIVLCLAALPLIDIADRNRFRSLALASLLVVVTLPALGGLGHLGRSGAGALAIAFAALVGPAIDLAVPAARGFGALGGAAAALLVATIAYARAAPRVAVDLIVREPWDEICELDPAE